MDVCPEELNDDPGLVVKLTEFWGLDEKEDPELDVDPVEEEDKLDVCSKDDPGLLVKMTELWGLDVKDPEFDVDPVEAVLEKDALELDGNPALLAVVADDSF